jgi:ABC-2 type transport system permease protein
MIICFLFYFIFGYLVYASLFAGIGSAVDNETDTQQFILPVTIPLYLPLVLISSMANAPQNGIIWWLSMIPLTSPVAMIFRIPSGVPLWELITSMFLLVAFFVFCVWASAKIYRTGILMYGKKITWRELWKWIRY